MDVHFRRLTDDDLVVLHRWLNEPGVVRWWEGDNVSDEVKRWRQRVWTTPPPASTTSWEKARIAGTASERR